MGLTTRQKIMMALQSLIAEEGIPPTQRQIAERVGFKNDSGALIYQLRKLEKLGYISIGKKGQSRNVKLLRPIYLTPKQLKKYPPPKPTRKRKSKLQ